MSAILPLYHATMGQVARQYPVFANALVNHHNIRKRPISFQNRPSLIELYTDLPRLPDGADIVKAVQTGVTELLLQLAFHAAGVDGQIIAYVIPTDKLRDRVVQMRVDPLLQGVPAYRRMTPQVVAQQNRGQKVQADNLKIKRFGRGVMLFLSAGSSTDFVEFSADTMIIDEYDKAEMAGAENLAMAFDRLRESENPRIIRLGNPEIARRGISEIFTQGDMRRFHFRCGHCNEYQPIDWWQNIVVHDSGGWMPRDLKAWRRGDEIRPVCRRCAKPFTLEARGAAWVPERLQAGLRRSYTMSRLDILNTAIRHLYEREFLPALANGLLLKTFKRSVLGYAEEMGSTSLSVESLEKACTGPLLERQSLVYPEGKRPIVSMGVDVGSLLHVSLSEDQRTKEGTLQRVQRFTGTFVYKADIVDFARRMGVTCAVIDVGPELRMAGEFVRECMDFGVSAWTCQFHPTERTTEMSYGMKPDYDIRKVWVDRTQIFDLTHEDILEGRRIYPRDVRQVLGWSEQMRAPQRILNKETGRFKWDEGGKPDHFRLADIYDRIARDMAQGGAFFSTTNAPPPPEPEPEDEEKIQRKVAPWER